MKPGEFLRSIGVSFRFVAASFVIDGKTPFKYKVTLSLGEREFAGKFTKGAAHVGKKRWIDGRFQIVHVDYYQVKEILRRHEYGEARITDKLHPIPPDLDEYADAILLDCKAIAEDPMWEDFASTFGYNPDSIENRKVWKACCRYYRGLRRMLGYSHFANLLKCESE